MSALIGLSSHWAPVVVLFAIDDAARDRLERDHRQPAPVDHPAHLLGRVNSVYRFFAWGMMPIGAAIGGLTVVVVDAFTSRDWALRATFLVCAAIHVWLYVWGRASLTTERLEAARAEGALSPTASGDATP